MRYEVDVITTSFFTGTLKVRKLQDVLNSRADRGWELSRTISEERRMLLFFRRDAHFLIFQQGNAPSSSRRQDAGVAGVVEAGGGEEFVDPRARG